MDATFDDGTRCWGLEKAGITVKSTKPIRASPAGSFDTGEGGWRVRWGRAAFSEKRPPGSWRVNQPERRGVNQPKGRRVNLERKMSNCLEFGVRVGFSVAGEVGGSAALSYAVPGVTSDWYFSRRGFL